jgi:threonine/homoserine/homoserine lactone efflux protein
MVYGFIAAFGVTFVANALVAQQSWLRVGGGLFLVYLGVRAFLSKPAGESASPRAMGLAAAYLSTFLLTLTNPMTILAFAAVFSGVGLPAAATYAGAGCLVVGVFAGSSLWWLLLSGGVSLVGHRVTTGGLLWINRVSGAVIVASGIAAIVLSRQG